MVTDLDFTAFRRGIERMDRSGELPEWARDLQARSRESRERLLRAAYDLVASGGLDALTMQALSKSAGLSIGATYARFPSKAAVVALLGVAVLEDGFDRIDRATRRRRSASSTLEGYLAAILGLFRTHRSVVRAIRQAASDSPMLSSIVSASNERIHELVRGRLLAQVDAERAERVEYALMIGSAAVREAVLYDAWRAYAIEQDDRRLLFEVHAAMQAYLAG